MKIQPVDNLSTFPGHVLDWLHQRGLTDEILKKYKIWWNGTKIVIPIFDAAGSYLYSKYRRSPISDIGPKYTYDAGSKTALYNAQSLPSKEVIVTEGEFDALILESYGFTAVSSTGGALSFQEEWAANFVGIDEVYVCFDNDKAGEQGKMRVCDFIPHAKIISLPREVGEHGDITDFFIKLGKTTEQFRNLMKVAWTPPHQEPEEPKRSKRTTKATGLEAAKLVPLQEFIKLEHNKAKCPFHPDGTPSFHVYPDNRWHCFGCGIGGDVVDFIMKKYGLGMKEAIEKILYEK